MSEELLRAQQITAAALTTIGLAAQIVGLIAIAVRVQEFWARKYNDVSLNVGLDRAMYRAGVRRQGATLSAAAEQPARARVSRGLRAKAWISILPRQPKVLAAKSPDQSATIAAEGPRVDPLTQEDSDRHSALLNVGLPAILIIAGAVFQLTAAAILLVGLTV